MAELRVFPVVLTGGLHDSKAGGEPTDLQTLTNFTVFRGRYALRAPISLVSQFGSAITQILALAYHDKQIYALVYDNTNDRYDLYSMPSAGGTPSFKATIWSSLSPTLPVLPILTSMEGGSATAGKIRLYVSNYNSDVDTTFLTRYWDGSTVTTVTEDLNDDNTKENLIFQVMAAFQYHVWGFGFWLGSTFRAEIGRFTQPGIIPADEPDVTYNIEREWWSVDWRPFGRRGERITGVGYVQNGMLVFKESETYLVWGYDESSWQNRILSATAGSIGPYAAATDTQGLCYWWSRRGPQVSDGQSVPPEFGEQVRKRVLEANPANDTVVVHSPTDGQVYFIYRKGAATEPNHWLAFNTVYKSWSEGEWLADGGGLLGVSKSVPVPQLTLSAPAAGPSPPTAIDEFCGTTDNTDINLHTPCPTSVWTSWIAGDPAATEVIGSKAQGVAGFTGGKEMLVINPGVVSDNFELWADIIPDGTFATSAGIAFRSNGLVGSTEDWESWVAHFIGGTDTNMTIQLDRFDNRAQVETTNVTGLNLSGLFTTGLRLGVTVNGSVCSVWTEPYGGGARTVRINAYTMTTSYNDASHEYFGFYRTSTGDIGTTWDNLTLADQADTDALQVTILDEDSAQLDWVNGDTAQDTTTEIYRETAYNYPPTNKVGEVASGVETFIDTGMNSITNYWWWVRHQRNGYFSAWSTYATGRTTLARPTNTFLTKISNGLKVTLTNTEDGADIAIERRTGAGGFSVVQTLSSQTTGVKTWDDTTANCGQEYTYRTRTIKTGETTSLYSPEISAVACFNPDLNTCSKSVTPDYPTECLTQVEVYWTGANLTGHKIKIYRHYNGGNEFISEVAADAMQYFDDQFFQTADDSEPNRNLYYTLDLYEMPGMTFLETCTTATTQHKLRPCMEF